MGHRHPRPAPRRRHQPLLGTPQLAGGRGGRRAVGVWRARRLGRTPPGGAAGRMGRAGARRRGTRALRVAWLRARRRQWRAPLAARGVRCRRVVARHSLDRATGRVGVPAARCCQHVPGDARPQRRRGARARLRRAVHASSRGLA
eukprot:1677351-Prymnesium_polylepis.1